MNKYILKTILLFFLALTCLKIQAQSLISGTVKDAESNEALFGASLYLVGAGTGTTTDLDGNFSIESKDPFDTLTISYIGYEKMRVPLQGQTSFDILIGSDSKQLDEVVVVGYGTTKKREVTGATSRIKSEEIRKTPVLRTEQALQGRTSGVQVISSSGQPGEQPTVRIRGTGTTGNANPLFIVDGIALTSIDFLNPGDIESIDVLKDAASAAIYGARAANGVVLITTKSGYDGKMSVSYSGYYGIQTAANQLEMLDADEYKMIMNEGARNAGLTEPFDLNEISPHNTNWQNELFQNAPIQNHQISIAGGNAKSKFASSLSYFNQEGIIGGDKSNFERYTARLNSSHKVNKVFSFGASIAYTHVVRKGVSSNQSFNGPYGSALNLDPLTPVYEKDPSILDQYPYSDEPVVTDGNGVFGISNYVGAEIVNPLALIENDKDKLRKDEFVGGVFAALEPIKGLVFKTSVGTNLSYVLQDQFKPLFYLNGAQLNVNQTSVSKDVKRYFTWQIENTLSYEKQFGDHKLQGLVGTTAFEYNYENLYGFNTGVPTTDPDNVYLDQALDTLWDASGGAVNSALLSYFGRLSYNLKDRYIISGTLRRDGSSKFGANSRFGIFPSVGAAWVISDEEFMSGIGILNSLKLRASWGINGNQEIGDYQFVSVIDNSRRYDLGTGTQPGSSPEYIENQEIRWEESEQIDLGVDFEFFRNKLYGSIDVYQKTTNGLLEQIPIPAHVGNEGPVSNVGSVENKGVELDLNWRNFNNAVKYSIGINAAYNDNEVTHIGNTEKVLIGASWAIAGPVTRSEEGLPIAYFWGYKTDGIFQTQEDIFRHFNSNGELLQPNADVGDVRFVDVNGDGQINEDDRTFIGNAIPDWTFGMTGSMEFKGFDLSLFLQGTYGNEIFNGSQRQDLRYTNRTTKILDRWTGEGTSNDIPRYTWSDINNNYRISDLYVEDGSYIRIKNVQLGYSLPNRILNSVSATSCRIYASVENLLTITGYTGVDPEIGVTRANINERDEEFNTYNSFDLGIDRGVYPQARTFRIGLDITF